MSKENTLITNLKLSLLIDPKHHKKIIKGARKKNCTISEYVEKIIKIKK